MSTALSRSTPSSSIMPGRVKHRSFLKCQPQAYTPWRESMSERQINACFEQHILPELSARLEGAFETIPEFDREDAVQDAICQALEMFRMLRLYEISSKSTPLGDIATALAKFTSQRYLAGIRFATPHSASGL